MSGDVKNHPGMNYERETSSGKKVHISILPNPSRLASQNPMLGQGMARAVQHQNGGDRKSTMVSDGHTDASFSGQGVIYETMGLSELKSYETGSTVICSSTRSDSLPIRNQLVHPHMPQSSQRRPMLQSSMSMQTTLEPWYFW